MQKGLTLTFLLVLGSAQAASVPVVSLFKAQGGRVEIPPSLGGGGMEYQTYYPIKGAPTLQLNVSLDYDAGKTNRVSGYWFGAYREFFSSAERQKLGALVASISTRCLNILPDRLAAINIWLTAQNKKTKANETANFGPMELHFKREYDSGPSQFVTEIQLRRSGKPGVAPWVNYCTDSGTP